LEVLEEIRSLIYLQYSKGGRWNGIKLTNVTNDDSLVTGKIALAHLNEFPDYYDRLEKMEEEADKFWEKKM